MKKVYYILFILIAILNLSSCCDGVYTSSVYYEEPYMHLYHVTPPHHHTYIIRDTHHHVTHSHVQKRVVTRGQHHVQPSKQPNRGGSHVSRPMKRR